MSAWLWFISPVPSRPSSFYIPNKTPLLVLTLATRPGISPCRGVKENSHVSFLDRKDTEQSWHLGHPHPSVPLQGSHFCLGPGCSTCDRGHSLFGDKTVKLSANYVLPSVNMSQAECHSPPTLGKLVCLVWTANNIPHYWFFFSLRCPTALSLSTPTPSLFKNYNPFCCLRLQSVNNKQR